MQELHSTDFRRAQTQQALYGRGLTVHIVSSSFLQFPAAKKKKAERRKLLQTICTVKPLPLSSL